MKWFAQIIGTVLYTAIFAIVLYMITVGPVIWFIGLSTFWKIVVLLLFVGIIQGLIFSLHVIAMLPYGWLLKENIVATVIAVALLSVQVVFNIISLWKSCLGHGALPIIFCITASFLLIEFLIGSITGIAGCYKQ